MPRAKKEKPVEEEVAEEAVVEEVKEAEGLDPKRFSK